MPIFHDPSKAPEHEVPVTPVPEPVSEPLLVSKLPVLEPAPVYVSLAEKQARVEYEKRFKK